MEQSTQIEHKQRLNADEEELEALQTKRTLYDRVYELAEKFASNRFGQFVICKTDRVLKMVEDTAKWSLPQGMCNFSLHSP